MNCPGFEELMAFADGELEGAVAERVREHVASCPSCKSVIESQKHIEKAWRDSFVEPSELDLRRLERSLTGRMSRKPLYARLLPVAAVILVAVAAVRLMSTEHVLLRRSALPEVPEEIAQAVETVRVTASSESSTVTPTVPRPVAQEQAPAFAEEADDLTLAQGPETGGDGTTPTAAEGQLRAAALGGAAGQAGSGGGGTAFLGTLDSDIAVMEAPVTLADQAVAGGYEAPSGAGDLGTASTDQTYREIGNAEAAAGGLASGGGSAGSVEQPAAVASSSRADGEGAGAAAAARERTEDAVAEILQTTPASHGLLESETRLQVDFYFDSGGMPSSPDSLLLDESFRGWKDSLEGRFFDSLVVVPVKELREFLE